MHESMPEDHYGYHPCDHHGHGHEGTPFMVKVLNIFTYYFIIAGIFYLYSVSFLINRWDESEKDVSEFRNPVTKPKARQRLTHAYPVQNHRHSATMTASSNNSSPRSTWDSPSGTVAHAEVQAILRKHHSSTAKGATHQARGTKAKDVSRPVAASEKNDATKVKSKFSHKNSDPVDAATSLPFETFPGPPFW